MPKPPLPTVQRSVRVEEPLPRVELIEWRDSASLDGWGHEEISGPMPCVTAGFLLRETDDYVVLVQSLALILNGEMDQQFAIPKSCITRRRRLKA